MPLPRSNPPRPQAPRLRSPFVTSHTDTLTLAVAHVRHVLATATCPAKYALHINRNPFSPSHSPHPPLTDCTSLLPHLPSPTPPLAPHLPDFSIVHLPNQGPKGRSPDPRKPHHHEHEQHPLLQHLLQQLPPRDLRVSRPALSLASHQLHVPPLLTSPPPSPVPSTRSTRLLTKSTTRSTTLVRPPSLPAAPVSPPHPLPSPHRTLSPRPSQCP